MADDAKNNTLMSYILPIVGVAAMLGVLYPISVHFQGFSSIGAFEYIEGERDAVLFYGFHRGESSDESYSEALLRDAATGDAIAKVYWPTGSAVAERNARYLWVKSDAGLALYSATNLEELLD